jgi:ATP-dependent exoDNAse (exonuclease V) beta subunit
MGNTALASDGLSFRPARSDSLLHRLWPAVEAEFARQFAEIQKTVTADDKAPFVMPRLSRFEVPWVLPDAKLLLTEQALIDPPDESGDTDAKVDFYWVGSDARIAGTLTHRWLQLIADSLAANQTADAVFSTDVTERWIREAGIEQTAVESIKGRVERAVSSMLGDDKGRWILDGPGHTELALSGIADDELVSVVLDRVRIDDDGTHWIIDYKTSSHEGGNLEGFLRAEEDRYRPQLQRYAHIYREWATVDVKCALYLPLLSTFIEVSV